MMLSIFARLAEFLLPTYLPTYRPTDLPTYLPYLPTESHIRGVPPLVLLARRVPLALVV